MISKQKKRVSRSSKLDGGVKKLYRVVGSFDTETTNLYEYNTAIPILYILHLHDNCHIESYYQGAGEIKTCNNPETFIQCIQEVIRKGIDGKYVPIICGYNLYFDIHPILAKLNEIYDIDALAQTATRLYHLDLKLGNKTVLRFWDTQHLEPTGLATMGNACGFQKLDGWDYDLTRSPETPLTDREIEYAKRDTTIIPAYLRLLLEQNPSIEGKDLGNRILTATSLVRNMAYREIGKLTTTNPKVTLNREFERIVENESPKSFMQHALNQACMRGGLTFTSAKYASKVINDVISMDANSMHPHKIVMQRVPVQFQTTSAGFLTRIAEKITNTSLKRVLKYYHKPFDYGLNACIRFYNLRLRKDSPFEDWGIGLLSQSKFGVNKKNHENDLSLPTDERQAAVEAMMKSRGYMDKAVNAEFAYGKLMKAARCDIFVHEIELWNIAQVYEWESMQVVFGEMTAKFRETPTRTVLQTTYLFEQKDAMKRLIALYRADKIQEIQDSRETKFKSIPDFIMTGVLNREISLEFLDSYYTKTVKGKYNGIYGAQAMNEYKPSYLVVGGELAIDHSTIPSVDSWEKYAKKKSKVWFQYGSRIVGGSRMHLIIAMMLLYTKYEGKIVIVDGDTDSLKIHLIDSTITGRDLVAVLAPLHAATRKGLDLRLNKIQDLYPEHWSSLPNLGEFEVENEKPYDYYFAAWNKARIVGKLDSEGKIRCNITAAGLRRVRDFVNINHILDTLCNKYSFEEIAPKILGYNTFISNSIANSLQHHIKPASDSFSGKVTDYLGVTCELTNWPVAVYLEPAGRWLGETTQPGNAQNIMYKNVVYGENMDDSEKLVDFNPNDGVCVITVDGVEKYRGVVYSNFSFDDKAVRRGCKQYQTWQKVKHYRREQGLVVSLE